MTDIETVYQIAILSATDGSLLNVTPIDMVRELRYSRILNGIGRVAITFPADTPAASAFMLDNFIEIYRTSPVSGKLEKEETYLIRMIERFIDDNTEWIVIGGLSLNHLLTRRVIDPDDDPLVAGGYSTKAGNADVVITSYVYEQLGQGASVDRRIPNLLIQPPLNNGTPLGARLQHEKLYNEVRRMAFQSQIDITIERTTGNSMLFSARPIGQDRTFSTNYPGKPWTGFSIKRGTAESFKYTLDRSEEFNYCYALGPGNVGNRIILKVAGKGVADSPMNRCEFIHDARSTERGDALGLLSEARGALVEQRYKEEFEFVPLLNAPGSIYHQDWDLGDKVSGILDSEVAARQIIDVRIIEIEVNINEGEEQINITSSSQWTEAAP